MVNKRWIFCSTIKDRQLYSSLVCAGSEICCLRFPCYWLTWLGSFLHQQTVSCCQIKIRRIYCLRDVAKILDWMFLIQFAITARQLCVIYAELPTRFPQPMWGHDTLLVKACGFLSLETVHWCIKAVAVVVLIWARSRFRAVCLLHVTCHILRPVYPTPPVFTYNVNGVFRWTCTWEWDSRQRKAFGNVHSWRRLLKLLSFDLLWIPCATSPEQTKAVEFEQLCTRALTHICINDAHVACLFVWLWTTTFQWLISIAVELARMTVCWRPLLLTAYRKVQPRS